MVSESAPRSVPVSHSFKHGVPLWTLFLLLLFFTAAEVAFYEAWKHSDQQAKEAIAAGGDAAPFMPKVAMVLVLLIVLTVPKALIVLVYFMHLKFEKQIIIALAILPFLMAAIAVLPMLTDTRTLKPRAINHPEHPIGSGYGEHAAEHGDAEAESGGSADDQYY